MNRLFIYANSENDMNYLSKALIIKLQNYSSSNLNMKKRTYSVAIGEDHDERRTKFQKLAHQVISGAGVHYLMKFVLDTIMASNVQNTTAYYASIFFLFGKHLLPWLINKKEEVYNHQFVYLQDGNNIKVADMRRACGNFVTIKLCDAQFLLKEIINDVDTRGNSTAKRKLYCFLKYMINILSVASVIKDYESLHEVVENAITEKKKEPKVQENFELLKQTVIDHVLKVMERNWSKRNFKMTRDELKNYHKNYVLSSKVLRDNYPKLAHHLPAMQVKNEAENQEEGDTKKKYYDLVSGNEYPIFWNWLHFIRKIPGCQYVNPMGSENGFIDYNGYFTL